MIIVLHKPYGMLSQFTHEVGSAWNTLADLGLPPDVYPVGRLDADSEGMLVLSDEKALVSSLLEPVNGHSRRYWAQVEHMVTDQAIDALQNGIVVQGRITRPCKVSILESTPAIEDRTPPIRHRATVPTSWIEIELTEGRNRQVRRMTAAVGHPTLRLIRVGIGCLRINDLGLSAGTWTILAEPERRLLLQHP
jgi:23S rRNA pseudouridine2457 synthase